jgi:low temperature requirement protein LtrA
MWWLYFEQPPHDLHRSKIAPFIWGYGHYFVFASIAATGAGLQVAVDYQTRDSELTATEAALTVAVPIAIYLVSLWLLQAPGHAKTWTAAALPLAAIVVLAISAAGLHVGLIAVALAGMILVLALVKGRLSREQSAPI